jgi:hypothetical protein
MSANGLTVMVLVVLVLTAATVRVVAGPIVANGRGGSFYALGKTGPAPDALAAAVELAASDSRPAR